MTNTLFESENHIKQATHWSHSLRQIIDIYSDFIVIFFLAILYFSYIEYQHQSRMELIIEPKTNDFYFVDYYSIEPSSNARYRYVPLKISSIDGELITFKVGDLAYSSEVSITKHVRFDMAIKHFYFKKEELVVSFQTLSNWGDDAIIYDIARPKNIYINGWIAVRLIDLF